MDFDTFLSPFHWRYGSDAMRKLWAEAHRRRLWRRLWVALAEVQAEFGLLDPGVAADLRAHAEEVDVPRSLAIEAEIHHDLMAEVQVFAAQAPVGGRSIHLGATSTDIKDNADALRTRQALDLIGKDLDALLLAVAERIDLWADIPVLAFTHLQPAEPSTLGYRLAQFGQDLMMDRESLRWVRERVKGKGFKGAVGTGASFVDLLGREAFEQFERRVSERLDLPFYPVTTQTYPRKQEYQVVSALAGLGSSTYKFAFDLRLLGSPAWGELREDFGEQQVGSSAMPFKRNPVRAEKIDSLARYLAQLPRLAWDNAAHSLLERTLDDSANRRVLLPHAFLCVDEILTSMRKLVLGLEMDRLALDRNLAEFGPFAALERVMLAVSAAGADRQAVHERLRNLAMAAWDALQAGESNPLQERVCSDSFLTRHVEQADLRALFQIEGYVGVAPQRARELAARIRQTVEERAS